MFSVFSLCSNFHIIICRERPDQETDWTDRVVCLCVCVSVCLSVCVDCYSCSRINEVLVRVSIGFFSFVDLQNNALFSMQPLLLWTWTFFSNNHVDHFPLSVQCRYRELDLHVYLAEQVSYCKLRLASCLVSVPPPRHQHPRCFHLFSSLSVCMCNNYDTP